MKSFVLRIIIIRKAETKGLFIKLHIQILRKETMMLIKFKEYRDLMHTALERN